LSSSSIFTGTISCAKSPISFRRALKFYRYYFRSANNAFNAVIKASQ
jgi:hypothetical protein